MAKVSIVIPIFNVERYLEECLKSVTEQTLKDIEIICVNDGSTDGSPDIIKRFAAKDDRIKVIDKSNSGYGNTMNRGLDMATGDYIGIVESDDFASPEMFETLYDAAERMDVDVVKTNYYAYKSVPEKSETLMQVLPEELMMHVFDPVDNRKIFYVRPCIWAGLYKTSFLRDNEIRFNESPGASFQDTGFNIKVWIATDRAYLMPEGYLHYRTDNDGSSVKSASKVFCVCDEYASVEQFLGKYPEKKSALASTINAIKYETYRWNIERLSPELQHSFAERMQQEFVAASNAGELDKALFADFVWNDIEVLKKDSAAYVERRRKARAKWEADQAKKKAANAAQVEKHGKVGGFMQCCKDHGFMYSVKRAIKK